MSESNLNDLLCCPFCGELEDLAVRSRCSEVPTIEGSIYYYVECLPCDARSGNNYDDDAEFEGYKDGRSMAIEKWNTRAT